jgi:hypothetical protein
MKKKRKKNFLGLVVGKNLTEFAKIAMLESLKFFIYIYIYILKNNNNKHIFWKF